MRLYRGISVPKNMIETTIENLRREGLNSGRGTWTIEHEHPGNIDALHHKPDLSTDDTRSDDGGVDTVCACGDEAGATYYAYSHNRTETDDAPVLIEFEAEKSVCAIDGRDFLYTVFQIGDPEKATPVLERSFGKPVLRYAEKAWASQDQTFRIAQCDLAIHDPSVIEAHYANNIVLGGRNRTVFRSAFTVASPVPPEAIIRVGPPKHALTIFRPEVLLTEILQERR